MPNAFAYIALLGYPFIAVFFFRLWSVPTAVAVTLIGGYLFLPSEPAFDFPLLPVIDKNSIPALVAILMATLTVSLSKVQAAQARRRGLKFIDDDQMLPGWLPRSRLPQILLALFVAAAIGALLTNTEPLRVSPNIVLPGLKIYDVFSMLLTLAFILPPFLLGRKFFFSADHHMKLLIVFAGFGLVYTFLCLVEIRLSPQINTWVYGFFPHSFAQHVRGGGFRPLVFLEHGLWLAIYQAMAMTAALALSKAAPKEHRTKWLVAAFWIFAVMFLSRSLGGFVLAGIMLVAFLSLPQRALGIFCLSLVGVAILYPIMRMLGLFPLESLVNLAGMVDGTRAGSLNFRFVNEELLIGKSLDKMWFGWGGWGRNAIYDFNSGGRISIVDSQWIVTFGVYGLGGLIAETGLYSAALIAIVFGATRIQVPAVTLGIMAMLALNMVDMLVNATSTATTWLLAGALTGYVEASRQKTTAQKGQVQQTAAARNRPRRAQSGAALARDADPDAEETDGEDTSGTIHRYTRQRTKRVRTV